jgi:head-tail adaptor
MNTGDKDKYLSIQVKTETLNDVNEPVRSWAHSFYMWAHKMTAGAKQIIEGHEIQSETVVFTMDECSITNDHRIVDEDGVVHEIQTVIEKNHDYIVKCRAIK